ncbi:MAG: hypothetical protein AA908_08860 [Chlorobi bacterium NICIL-2]|nr:MAG: hypothetical protein AA908_08860 [Chlorobi bacterium NICIL-2]
MILFDGNNPWAVEFRVGAPIVLAQVPARLVRDCSRIHDSICRWTISVMPKSIQMTYFVNQNFA